MAMRWSGICVVMAAVVGACNGQAEKKLAADAAAPEVGAPETVLEGIEGLPGHETVVELP